jgi:hypothetical protein
LATSQLKPPIAKAQAAHCITCESLSWSHWINWAWHLICFSSWQYCVHILQFVAFQIILPKMSKLIKDLNKSTYSKSTLLETWCYFV